MKKESNPPPTGPRPVPPPPPPPSIPEDMPPNEIWKEGGGRYTMHTPDKDPKSQPSPPKGYREWRAEFLQPAEDGSIEEAGYEFANALTEEYRQEWWGILVHRIGEMYMSKKISETYKTQGEGSSQEFVWCHGTQSLVPMCSKEITLQAGTLTPGDTISCRLPEGHGGPCNFQSGVILTDPY